MSFNLGFPAKHSASGGLMVVIPNVMGIFTFSPRLDRHGISARGLTFCRELTSQSRKCLSCSSGEFVLGWRKLT